MRKFINIVLIFSIFIISINISWKISSHYDFYYQQLYQPLSISSHIQKYSVRNRNYSLRNFVNTNLKDHYRIFHEIVTAINSSGGGLRNISFYSPLFDRDILFLTSPEIIHLKDVSKLVDRFNLLTWGCVLLSIIGLIFLKIYKFKFFNIKEIMISFSLLSLLFSFAIFSVGPLEIFYYLHEVFFSKNQWFFYYEESLMTTLMKAPQIFGYISGALLLLSFVIFYIFIRIIQYHNASYLKIK